LDSHRRGRAIAGLWALSALLASALGGQAGAADVPRLGDWPTSAHDPQGTRFSPLEQIGVRNVGSLRLAFSFATGVERGQEAAPLVIGDTMFLVTPFPNYVYALDLTQPTAPVKWKFDPKPDVSAQGVACCDLVNRGVDYADGRVFFNTLDAQTIALDAASGRELWRTRLGDIGRGETMTMAPLVVKGKVLVGNSGGELGVRGWLTALDAATGRIAWRAWSTGPDKEVLIGASFKPFYAQDRGSDLGVSSWPGTTWKIGGGNVWGFLSYDPDLDLLFYGTGNPGPWNPEQRPGANKWTSGIFARRPDTGEAVWYYQWSPHDLHDYDGVNENVLVELAIGGKPRRVIVHADRNGYLYVLDRATGQVLSADPFVPITTSTRVDLETGALVYNPAKDPRGGEVVRNICPASPGGKDWQPAAWSPRTRLLYIPHQNLCQDAETYQVSYIAGTTYVGLDTKIYAGAGGHRGEFTAWDPVARKKAWALKESFPVWSGALATGGDVVFYGTMEGWFKAVDAKTGALLWKFKTSSGIIGQPISYLGPDGKQYVAVYAGIGGDMGLLIAGDVAANLPYDVRERGSTLPDLARWTSWGGMLFVFGL
jgi:PQQ-dependent dehydrogenase (methanol/ethanol family)